MSEARDLRATGDRIERLLGEIQATSDAPTWAHVEDVVQLVNELYGAGIERILEIVTEATEISDAAVIVDRLAADELVGSLLVVHGLHPDDLATRVARALDDVRPYLGSHGGDVELVDVDEAEGAVLLKMLGSCDGCPSSSVTLKLAVESAIQEAAPEIVRIDVEGALDPAPVPATGATPVQLTRKVDAGDAGGAWAPVYGLNRVGPGRLEALTIAGDPVICCRVGKTLYAYRDQCPACASSLGDSTLEGEVLRCSACGASYDVRLAGRGLDGSGAHLEPLPLLEEPGVVKISVPAGATA